MNTKMISIKKTIDHVDGQHDLLLNLLSGKVHVDAVRKKNTKKIKIKK